MLSSSDIAQMVSAQNGMFMGQNTFANQIGVSSPGMGLGGYGSPGAPQQQGHIPGMHAGPSPYNYGGGFAFNHGYASGNRFASNMMSGIGGAASAVGVGLSVAGMFGKLGPVGPLMDPFSMFGAARGMGMGIAGSAGMAALPIAGAMAMGAGVNAFVHGGQQNSAVNTMMGSFQHFNPASRTGSGFSRQDSAAMSDVIRQMSHIPDMMTSMGELTKIAGKLKDTGLMQGVKDVQEFSRRFKDAIGTIRETARILGTTMEDATKFFSHSRGVGFLGAQDQLKNVMNAQFSTGISGMNQGQFMQMQQGGANMATQFGARRRLGTQAITAVSDTISLAQRNGYLSEGLLQDVTGLEGPEAIQAAAGRMTEALVKSSQSAPGRLIMAGLVKFDEKGRAIGLDDDLVKQFNAGSLSTGDLKRRAGGLTERQKASFTHRQSDLAMDMAGKVGPGGMARFIDELVGGTYGSEGSGILLNRVAGLSASEADLMMELRSSGGGEADRSAMARISARESSLKERYDPKAMIRKVKQKAEHAIFGGIEKQGAMVYEYMAKAYENFWDDVLGRYSTTLTKEGADAFARAFSGGDSTQVSRMFTAASGQTKGMTGFGEHKGGFLRSLGSHGDNRTAVEQAKILQRLSGVKNGPNALAETQQAAELLDMGAMKNFGSGSDDPKNMRRLFRKLARGIEGFEDMQDTEKTTKMREALTGFLSTEKDRGVASATGNTYVTPEMAIKQAAYSDSELEKQMKSPDEDVRLRAAALKRFRLYSKTQLDPALGIMAEGNVKASRVGINFGAQVSPSSISQYLTTKGRAEEVRGAEDALFGKMSQNTISILKNKGSVRDAVMKAMGDDSIAEAIDLGDKAKAIRELRKKGVNINSPSELDEIYAVYNEISEKPGMKEALGKLDTALKGGEGGVIFQAMADASAKISLGLDDKELTLMAGSEASAKMRALGDQLKSVGAADITGSAEAQGAERMKRFEGAQKTLGELAEMARAEKDPDRREAIFKMAGDLAPGLRRMVSSKDSLGKLVGSTVTRDKVMSKLGISDKDSEMVNALDRVMPGSKGVTMTKQMVDELSSQVGRVDSARSLVGKDGSSSVATDPTQKLIQTLEKIDSNMSIVATVLASGASDEVLKLGRQRVQELTVGGREDEELGISIAGG